VLLPVFSVEIDRHASQGASHLDPPVPFQARVDRTQRDHGVRPNQRLDRLVESVAMALRPWTMVVWRNDSEIVAMRRASRPRIVVADGLLEPVVKSA